MRDITRIVFASSVLAIAGCNLADALPKRDTEKKTDPVEPDKGSSKYSEQDYVEELAKQVESGLFQNTDDVVATAKRLERRGFLKSMSQFDTMSKKRVDITDSNKAEIAGKVRGR